MAKQLANGIYFLHISFLKEASQGMTKEGVTKQLDVLMNLVFSASSNPSIMLISCDRRLCTETILCTEKQVFCTEIK